MNSRLGHKLKRSQKRKLTIDKVDKSSRKGRRRGFVLDFRLAGEQNNLVVVDASERICKVFGFEMRGVLLG